MSRYEINFTTNNPSEIILAALADLEAAEAQEGYVIDMGTWHEPLDDEDFDDTLDEAPESYCHVCLAGAIMARVTGYDDTEDVTPEDFDEKTEAIFLALDDIRHHPEFCVHNGVKALCETLDRHPHQAVLNMATSNNGEDYPIYRDDPNGFKSSRRRLAYRLQHLGL